MGICTKLNEIQVALNAPKGQRNTFGNYNYRSCEDILEALKPLLKEHKCTVKISDNIELIGERYYVKATATIKDTETLEEESSTAYAREEENKKGMDSSQITGAASSYARKYALNGLLCIDDNKDSDSTNTHGKDTDKAKNKSNQKKELSDKQVARLIAISNAAGVTLNKLKEKILKETGKHAIEELTKQEYDAYCERLENAKK